MDGSIPARPRAVLIDLAGVLHVGNQPVPGAREALERLRASGLPLRFLTNTTRSPRTAIVRLLQGMGLAIAADEIQTAVHATRQYVESRWSRPYYLVHPDIADEVSPGHGNPDVVVLGDAGPGFTFERMNEAFRLLMDGRPLVAMARNRYFREHDGLTIDMGAYVAALEYAAGVQATVVGKPAAPFFLGALAELGVTPGEAVVIGDDLHDDIGGAQAAGIAGILVRTGKFRPVDETAGGVHPALIVDDFASAIARILQA